MDIKKYGGVVMLADGTMDLIDYCKELTESDKVKIIMSKLNQMSTIKELAESICGTDVEVRRIVSKIRKKHPIFADRNGRGYKYASKEEAKCLKKFEEKTIKMHQKNLAVINKYLGLKVIENG